MMWSGEDKMNIATESSFSKDPIYGSYREWTEKTANLSFLRNHLTCDSLLNLIALQ